MAAYIKETGDYEILDEPVPFDCKKGTEEPLFEHLNRSFQFTVTHLGPHRLPLIGRADWNDCLNLNCFSSEPGEPFQTTGPSEGSVARVGIIAAMFVNMAGNLQRSADVQTGKNWLAEAEKAVIRNASCFCSRHTPDIIWNLARSHLTRRDTRKCRNLLS